jgi:hypothetical protein
MKLFSKKILKYLPIQFQFFIINKINVKKEIKSKFYNAEATVYPFTKPISKIIKLENASMEGQ